MKKTNINYNDALVNYVNFLKKNKLYVDRKKFFYENNIEKMFNWSGSDFKKSLSWYLKIRNSDKTKVKTIHLEKMKKWIYDKKKRYFET